ncbi:MAG: amidase family protein [Solirubrobacteraceae bacterium]
MTVAGDEEIAFAGVARLSELLHASELAPRELVELYLSRIERLNPRVNAFVSIRAEKALAEADAALVRLRTGETGALLGVPVVVKDNVDIAGEVTTHGTAAQETPASADAEGVRRLRAAGAPILGKTTLPELATCGQLTESPTYGVTRNPWDPARTTGGTSGGTAAVVAAGLAAAGLGADGAGSIRVPAAFCGLFALAPSRGRISTMPDPEHWHGLTVFGGLARTVLDAALVDDVLRGPAPGDIHAPPQPNISFAQAAAREPAPLRVAVSLKGMITGIRPGPVARRAVEQTAELLRSLGHHVDEHDPSYGQLSNGVAVRSLAGIADDAAKLDHPDRLGDRARRMAALGRRLQGRALRRAMRREPVVARRVNAIFAHHDLLLTPVTAVQPAPVEQWHDAGMIRTLLGGGPYVTYTAIWNYLGQPAATIPAGMDENGLPTAIQLAGPPGSETTIIPSPLKSNGPARGHSSRHQSPHDLGEVVVQSPASP